MSSPLPIATAAAATQRADQVSLPAPRERAKLVGQGWQASHIHSRSYLPAAEVAA